MVFLNYFMPAVAHVLLGLVVWSAEHATQFTLLLIINSRVLLHTRSQYDYGTPYCDGVRINLDHLGFSFVHLSLHTLMILDFATTQ